MENISNSKDCYGCGVCAVSCNQKIINIELDENGFYHPQILDKKKCTRCGLCLSVCAYLKNVPANAKSEEIDSYAAWSNDNVVRHSCSSGGIGFELAKFLMLQGYNACGVKYNAGQCRAEHFVTGNFEEYRKSIGSKYLQSYTLNAFDLFEKKERYFVTGTPCQIDSLRRYLRLKRIEDKFVLMDFFCHGVPSMLLWKKYITSVENKIGKISNVTWRNKETGWHDSWVIDAVSQDCKQRWNSRWSNGDWFYKMFLTDTCLGTACYTHCKYKGDVSSADIRVGDLWGKEYNDNNDGISGVLVFTEKGKSVIMQLSGCTLQPVPAKIVMEGQMRSSPAVPIFRNRMIRLLKDNRSIKTINMYYFTYRIANKFYKLFEKWKCV